MSTRYAALCAFASCMAYAASASAAAPLEIPYTAPPGCPNAAAFATELATRGAAPRAGTPEDAQPSRRFSASIEKRGAVFTGELTVTHDGTQGTRRVESADCAAVVRSLAVFVALALAEDAEPKPTPPESAPREEVSEPEPPAPAPPSPAKTRRRAAAGPGRRPKPAPRSYWRFDSGVQAQYTRAGDDALGARVSAEWARHFASSPIAPALRLSWGFSSFSRPVDAGEIHFRLRTARAEVCGGTAWRSTYNSLCAAFELGQLGVASSGFPRNGRAESSWSAAGLIARTRVTILDPISVELALGLFSPFQRAEFTLIDPVRQVYRVPAVALEGQLGVAVTTRW